MEKSWKKNQKTYEMSQSDWYGFAYAFVSKWWGKAFRITDNDVGSPGWENHRNLDVRNSRISHG